MPKRRPGSPSPSFISASSKILSGAKQLAEADSIDDRALAELWLADRRDSSKRRSTPSPLTNRPGLTVNPTSGVHELDKAHRFSKQLGAEIPKLPPYDPAKDEKFPWEDKVVAAIEKLRKEKEAKQEETDE